MSDGSGNQAPFRSAQPRSAQSRSAQTRSAQPQIGAAATGSAQTAETAEAADAAEDAEDAEAAAAAEDAARALIARVGERVRKARELKRMPRRELSARSGVSPRYLAQLEAGAGNISIGLLQRVACALDLRLETLVGAHDPWDDGDAARIAALYRAAPADARAQALAILTSGSDAGPSPSLRARRICLVGLRGAGKSTLGAAAGAALGLPFVELNRDIEDDCGMPVTEVMALYGQEGYRKLEAQAIARVIAAHDAVVLAVAGGVVAEPDTYALLLERFHTIWIKASPDEHMARVRAQGDTRPMAGNPEAMAELRAILAARDALYAKALAALDTSGRSVDQSSRELVDLIRARGFLD